jgi:hypothetical protein
VAANVREREVLEALQRLANDAEDEAIWLLDEYRPIPSPCTSATLTGATMSGASKSPGCAGDDIAVW